MAVGDGDLTRPRPGQERLALHLRSGSDRGEWRAEVQPSGVVWTRDGKRVAAVPAELAKLYERMTIFPDPQKKEGSARLAGREGDAIRYDFTDVNTGQRYSVWVSSSDGRIIKLTIDQSTMTFG